MGHSKKPRRSRAHRAPADALFERALLGEGSSDNRSFNPRNDRKTRQLCRQVQRAIAMALGGGDVLSDATVESVEPLGGPGQLLVRVAVPLGSGVHPAEVMARLTAQTPRLRATVAAEVCRKRVPMLSFVVVPLGPLRATGEAPQSADPVRASSPALPRHAERTAGEEGGDDGR